MDEHLIPMDDRRLRSFFEENLAAVTDGRGPAFPYVVDLLAAKAHDGRSAVHGLEAVAIVIEQLWNVEYGSVNTFEEARDRRTAIRWAAEQFRSLGDDLLFYGGFLPESLDNTHKRRGVGLGYYLGQGPRCYEGATVIIEQHPWLRATRDPVPLATVASQFDEWREALYALRSRFDEQQDLKKDYAVLRNLYAATKSPTMKRQLAAVRLLPFERH